MKESCIDTFDDINCNAAVDFCDNELSARYEATGEWIQNVAPQSLI